MLPSILKNWVLFVDGRGYAGRCDELELPTLSIQTEEHRAGGMDAPAEIDMGMDAMEATWTMADYDPNLVSLFGLADGRAVQVTARGAMQRDGEAVIPVIATMRGQIKEFGPGTWQAGEKTQPEYTMALRYYRLEIGGTITIEIDVDNMIRRIGGRDQMEQIRAAIGI